MWVDNYPGGLILKVWIDADSCPRSIRDVVGRACKRLCLDLIFVANREIPFDPNHNVSMVVVTEGESPADKYLIDQVKDDDLVITRDIPLAAELVTLSRKVINDRGIEYTTENVRERLSVRDFMANLRDLGLPTQERHSIFGKKEIAAFSAAFDRIITRSIKNKAKS